MGEDFFRKQREGFVQRRNRAFREFTTPDLLSTRPELFDRAFTFRAPHGVCIDGADSLEVVHSDGLVRAVRNGNEAVGVLDDPSASELIAVLAGVMSGGLPVELDEQSNFGAFSVRIAREGDQHAG